MLALKVIILPLTLWAFVVFTSSQADMEPTLTKDGDFIIEALLSITSNGGKLYETYALASEAIRRTVDDINNKTKTDILPNITLGYKIVNDKLDLNYIMKEAIGIVSKYRPNSICREDEEFCTANQKGSDIIEKRVSAVIGPATSSSSVASASLLGLYHIPQIGYSASSSILSDKSRFKSFLRTIPSDKYQAEAMASFVKYFEWNYVFLMGSDDEYGRQGLANFKTAARKLKVCTADDVNIPFQREDDADKQIKEVVQKMKNSPRVRVAILFMFESQAIQFLREAEKQGVRNMTYILSDAIGPNIASRNGTPAELLHGAFGVDFAYETIPNFEKHLMNVTIESVRSNPWMLKLFEKQLDCSITGKGGKKQCKKDDTLNPEALNLTNRWSALVSVINSVKAIATGLDNLLKCNGRLENGLCPNTTFPLSGRDLYSYIRNASFTSPTGKQVSFDDQGDLTRKMYTFRNVLLDRQTNTLEFKRIGEWSSRFPARPRFFDHGLTWNTNEVPTATCSEACPPGQKQVGMSDCCWACHPCPKGEVSNTTGATQCNKCPLGTYANEEQTKCLMTEIDYVDASDAFSIVIIIISCIGIVAMVAVASLFFYVRDTPLIQDSDPILLGLLVFSALLGFVFTIFQVSLYRNDAACRFLGAFLLYVVLLVGGTLLAKTKTCDAYLRKFTSHYLKPAAQYSAPIMIGALFLFQLLLMGIWLLTDSPIAHYMESSQALHIRECNSSWTAARFIATGFPLIVLFLATAFAFKERDARKNHSEAKYISFCTISMCILLIAFFPTYRFARGITTTVVISTTSLVGSIAVICCILLPKVYILTITPDRNVPEEERERSHNTASSAHTAGSQHKPVSPGPVNDVEFMSSASSAKDVVKDVPVI